MMGTEKTKEELLEEIAFLQKKLQILEQDNKQLSPPFLPKESNEVATTYQKDEIEANSSVKELICLHDLSGRIIRVNDEVADILDIYSKDGSTYNLKNFLAPDVRHHFANYLNEVINEQKSEGSLKIIDKEGNIRAIQYQAHLVESENHTPYVHCKAKDISQSEKKYLNASNEFYKNLYEKNVSFILLLSLNGQVVDANETAIQRFRLPKTEMIGVNFADLVSANKIDIGQHALQNIYEEVWQGKTVKITVDSSEESKKTTTVELAFKKAKFYKQDMIICFGDDITQAYDSEQEIISKYNELRVIKETIRYISGQYKVTEVLMMALEKLYELEYIKSAGFYKINRNGLNARLRFHLNIENEILSHILEIKVENYLTIFSEKQPYEIPAGKLYPEQEALVFIPIIVENKVNFALLFKLDPETHDGSSLLLNLLGAELSSYLTQVQLNNKLVQSENRFRIIADNSPSLLRMTNSNNEFVFFSQPWFVFTGKSNERQLRDNWGELIHEEDIDGVEALLKENFTSRNSFELSYRLRRSDGSYRWMLENGTPYYDDQEGEFKGYICSAVDVTERRQKEKEQSQEDAIKYSKERLQKALNQANIFAITIEKNGLISYCNEFFYKKTNWKEEDVIDKYLFNVFETDTEGEAQLFHIDGLLNTFEGTLHTAGNETIHIRFNSIVLNDRTGNIASFTIVGEDVSEKFRVQEALRESNMRLQDLFDNANDLIQVTGADGKILFANRAWKQTLGYSDEEMESLKIMDILHADKAIDTYRTFGKVKKTGEVSNAQTALVAKNGKKIDLSGRFSYDEKENEFRAYLYNITERIRLDNAQNLYYNIATLTLNSTNLGSLYEGFYNALKRVIEVDSFVVAIKDKYDDKKIYFPYHINSRFAPKEGIQGINFVNYAVANFERPIFMYEGVIRQILVKKKITPDTVIPKVWLGVPLKLGEKIIGMIVLQGFKEAKLYTKKDLTLLSFISGQLAIAIKRNQNQEEISQQAARLKAIFDSGTHLMWTVNRQMLITRFNQKANANNNDGNAIVPSDLVGYEDTTDKLKQGEFLYFWLNKYRKTFEGKQQHFESKIINEQGTEVWYEVFLNPIKVVGADGIDEISGVANNITAKKRYELALAEAKEVAEKSLEVKKSFLSNMSHEIRTPMNGIIGMIELLADSTLDQEQQNWITTIRKSSETLLNILNDILDLSKIEAGKMELRKAPISLKALIDKLFALFMQRALSKDIVMTDYFEREVPIFINADETRLLQILSNLTSNALKFTEQGEINIRFYRIAQEGQLHKIKVEVQDSGIGIPEEKLAILFKAFSQADNSYTKSYGGTGLGLVISQELCKLMNGEIGVASILGKGSTFWFTFEAQECSEADVPIEENLMSKQGGGHIERISYIAKVLVVDDNSVNLKVAKNILQKAGCTVETAQSGQAAINLVRQNHYDIIFMDIQMPIMNGVTATQHIKALALPTMPPIIAMTAFSMQEERQSFLDEGMDDYVSKPIKAQILINKVKEWGEKIGLPQRLVTAIEEKQASHEPLNIELISPKKEVESLFRVTQEHIIGLILNKEVVAQLRKYGDDEMIEVTYQEFEEETTNIINELADAIDRQFVKEAMGCAHTIKGSAGTLGIERLAAHAAKMEQEFKNGTLDNARQDLDTMNILFDEFKENYKDLL